MDGSQGTVFSRHSLGCGGFPEPLPLGCERGHMAVVTQMLEIDICKASLQRSTEIVLSFAEIGRNRQICMCARMLTSTRA